VASRDAGRGRPVEEVLEQELDGVVISSSTGRHPDDIGASAERGFPMLCEKPLSLTLSDTRRTLDVVSATGATLQVAFQRRFDPGFVAAREAVRDGSLGAIYLVRLNSHDHEPSPERYIPTSGGIFRDLNVHDFDLVRWLTGLEVAEVYAVGAVRKWERFGRYGDVDTAAVLLTMDDGLPVLVSGARHDPRGYDFRAEVYGSEDSLAVGLGARTPIRSVEADGPPPSKDPYRGFLDRFSAAFEAELDAWLEVVAGRAQNPCPGETALEALRVAIACDRSRAEHKPVRVAEVGDDAT
jgi:myo-inositol 2-dehydrogenase/D-chiro-inositol 1-dehydrogenase